MKKIDISAILIGHSEGWMLYPSILGMLRAIQRAENLQLSVEMIVILDRPDEITEEYAQANCPPDALIIHIDKGDLAEARNHAISRAKGDYIAFLDGDDLWSLNWLTDAYTECKNSKQPLICHPEVNIFLATKTLYYLGLG